MAETAKPYEVDFGTGAGNESFATVEEAKVYAEENAAFTQESIVIRKNGEGIVKLPWYGVEPDEDDAVVCAFGTEGFYSNWVDC